MRPRKEFKDESDKSWKNISILLKKNEMGNLAVEIMHHLSTKEIKSRFLRLRRWQIKWSRSEVWWWASGWLAVEICNTNGGKAKWGLGSGNPTRWERERRENGWLNYEDWDFRLFVGKMMSHVRAKNKHYVINVTDPPLSHSVLTAANAMCNMFIPVDNAQDHVSSVASFTSSHFPWLID